jgi:hypothetical protein
VRGEAVSLLTRHGLMNTRTRAVRQRIWFRALSRVERGIVDLTIRCVERIRSRVLAGIVSTIVTKILKHLKPSFLETAMKVGRDLADEISSIAVEWGNDCASRWRHDLDFTRYLGVKAINRG